MKKWEAGKNRDRSNQDSYGNGFYHPSIQRNAIGGAVLGGVLSGVSVWLLAHGILPVEGLAQLSSGNLVAAALLGFISGSAIGGLSGSVYGIFVMLKERG